MLALVVVAAVACPIEDARAVVARSDQAVTGHVVAAARDRFTVEVEHSKPGIGFGERVVVVRDGAASVRVGDLVGVVLRPRGSTWVAGRCDMYASARLSRAIEGHDPCPAPRIRRVSVRLGRAVRTRASFSGDVTSASIAWDGVVRQRVRVENPGLAGLSREDRLRTARPGQSGEGACADSLRSGCPAVAAGGRAGGVGHLSRAMRD
jgi:hypothetical protein